MVHQIPLEHNTPLTIVFFLNYEGRWLTTSHWGEGNLSHPSLLDCVHPDVLGLETPLIGLITSHSYCQFLVEVGRYIENIVDISPISIYRYRIGTLDIGFSIYRYRIGDK